jgi:SAM-dependent methyltransferase
VIKKLYEDRAEVRRKILDVGCGDGLLARILASEPYLAQMKGFDSAPNLLDAARKEEEAHRLGISYILASAHEYRGTEECDDATSVMVLPYAPDATYLKEFLASASSSLQKGGRFISIVFNPEFRAFDQIIGNRRFTRTEDGKVQVHFLDVQTKQPTFTSLLTQFSTEEYDRAALDGGFAATSWEKVYPIPEAVQALGADFWKPCEEEQPYALLVVEK